MSRINVRPEKFWAGGFLYNPSTNEVFLHQRDSNTKFNPNKWAFFGGLNEQGESPEECFAREINEEMGLSIQSDNIFLVCEYLNEEFNTYRIVYYSLSSVKKEELTLGEGAGFDWVSLNQIDQYDLTEKTLKDLEVFTKMIKQ